jgi:group II intron reverse transcriptase/maturase
MLLKNIFSDENLIKAWKKSKKGYRCSGIDGITREIFESDMEKNLQKLRRDLLTEIYNPSPLTGFERQKGNGKKRSLSILCIRDHVSQQAVHIYVTPFFESLFCENSFAFRPDRSVDLAVKRIIEIAGTGYRCVLKADIASFFDTIDRPLLYKIFYRYVQSPSLLKLVKKWVEVGVIIKGKLLRSEKGIPQGTVIAPLLSNIYLHPFDKAMALRGYPMVRYCDDFVILSRFKKDAGKALEETVDILKAFRLTLKKESVLISDIETGFKFLGKDVFLGINSHYMKGGAGNVHTLSERSGNGAQKKERKACCNKKK